jgi:hypothetical protein
MKNVKTNQILKAISIVGILALTSTQVKAQSTAGSANVEKAAGGIPTVKVVDNKGTVKYFQSNNGITQITSTTAGSATTTTWQLGGTLTDDTYINATGKTFGLTGIALTTSSAATASGGTGYSLMVRDETTGKVEALLASSLVTSGQGVQTIIAGTQTLTGTFISTPFTGLTTNINSVSVYRNGVKLRHTTDWAFDATDPTSISIPTTSDLKIYTDDVIEVQWVK